MSVLAIGGEGNLTAAWFALAGALGAAVLAIIGGTLQRRAEAARLERQLAAETARTLLQLEHERALVDLAELRQLLDLAMQTTWEAIETSSTVWASLAAWTEGDEDALGAPLPSWLFEHRSEAFKKVWVLEDLLGRLSLRLGRDHATTAALADFRDAAQQAVRQIPLKKVEAEQLSHRRPELLARIRRTRTSFVDAAFALARART